MASFTRALLTGDCRRGVGLALLLILMALMAYRPALEAGFIWDDDVYVTENPNLYDVAGLVRSWTDPASTPGAQFYPLVYTSFWWEYGNWGLNPFGYHLDNVLLHGLTAVFLWRVLRALKCRGAWLAAAIFAVHPVMVESVAWVTERKNVLSGMFMTASLLSYLRFARLGEEAQPARREWGFLVLALTLFAGALLSKTVTCTLPVVILLLVWWRRGEFARRDVLPLVPMFAVGVGLALLTISVERRHMGTEDMLFFRGLTFPLRVLIAGRAAWFYVRKLLWPDSLSFIYPQLEIGPRSVAPYLCLLAGAVVVVGLWAARRRIGRGPLTGVLAYLVMVGPALGFFDVAQMRYSLVADHWVYHGGMAVAALLGTALQGLTDRMPRRGAGRVAAWAIAAALLLALGTLTWRQCRVYRNLETLWRDVVARNPEGWMPRTNLGRLLTEQGKADEALPHLEEAVRLMPDHYIVQNEMGNVLYHLGRVEESLAFYRRAMELMPFYRGGLENLGTALQALGRTDEAVALYEEAIASSDPAYAAVGHYRLGRVLQRQGRTDEAVEHFHASLRLAPGYFKPQLALQLMNLPATPPEKQ